ncbi:MAG: jacalin-like lectin [Pseudomonadota bacterium]
MTIRNIAIGHNHGTNFDIEVVRSIGFRFTSRVEAILLNGTRHGDNQGHETETLEMQPEEYISRLEVTTLIEKGETRVRHIKLTTSLNRTLEAGSAGSGEKTVLSGVRILGLGGNVGHQLFMLRVRFIENYKPSEVIPGDFFAVTNIIPQGQEFESFKSSRVARMNSSRFFLETVTSIQTTTEAGAAVGDFSAKASTEFGFSVTTQSEFTEQVETETTESQTIRYAPPEGHVGLEVVPMDAFRASDGSIWYFPTNAPSIVSAPVSGESVIKQDFYDMIGVLPLHLPYMAEQSYGFEQLQGLAKQMEAQPEAA